jgi:RNA polymerase sigma factor (sigma-70 family)
MYNLGLRNKFNKAVNSEDKIYQLSGIDQNFGLTKIQFDDIVSKLKSGNEQLFETIFLSHFNDCEAYLIRIHKADHEVAYDITMDTLIEFRKKLLCDKIDYGNLRYLFTKMASQHYIKSNIKENKLREIFDSAMEDEEDFEDRLSALKKAWLEMNDEDKHLLEKHYYQDVPLNKIAESENKSDSALRKQKQRAIEKLRVLFFTKIN